VVYIRGLSVYDRLGDDERQPGDNEEQSETLPHSENGGILIPVALGAVKKDYSRGSDQDVRELLCEIEHGVDSAR
jgi:hypothetical protein